MDANPTGSFPMDTTLPTHAANVEPKVPKEVEGEENTTSTINPPQEVKGEESPEENLDIPLDHLSQEISQFVASLSLVDDSHPLETPKYVDMFLDKVESKIEYYESIEPLFGSKLGLSSQDDPSFFMAILDLALLIDSVSKFKSTSSSAAILVNMATSHLHRAMLALEEELRVLLHKCNIPQPSSPTASNSHKNKKQDNQSTHCVLPNTQQQQQQPEEEGEGEGMELTFPRYSHEDILLMSSISQAMVAAGYEAECIKLFMIMRRGALEEELISQGFEKMSIDDIQKMPWETLASQIDTWIRVLKHCTSLLFPSELKLYQSIFSSTQSQFQPDHNISIMLFNNLASSIIQQLINLANAVSMAKRSSEKLFKFLDMYETLRDLGLWLADSSITEEAIDELKFELTSIGDCLGESIVLIFTELENSIKSDYAKQPVPNGAVHPLTRYTMNYLKYACEYKDNLEELFSRHVNAPSQETASSHFTNQLMIIMDLLDANLESKSKLYKDPALRYIFLMNNGRYILQKIRESSEIHGAVGDMYRRKRSSELRNYHKNYQRDTWSKVLQCLNPEGLQVNGKVQKLILKERFKNFNHLFDEIHRTQSTWVVSDEQLRSELRVSISAIMIPAYRAFLARFGQTFSPGRQYEKHIKYQPDDIETAIEELFDGSVSSMARRRT